MDSVNREQLARRQRQLIDALTQEDSQADGINPVQIRNTRQALLRKRMRGVERSWPELVEGLGAGFQRTFFEYSQGHTLKPGQSHEEDAFRFGAWLKQKGMLSESACIDYTLRSMVREGGWLRLAKPDGTSRRILIVRLPGRKFFTVRWRS